jgi:membrane associated rhomboid family serine protease
MHIDKPDPHYLHAPQTRSNLRFAFKAALVLTGILWLILIIDEVMGLGLVRFGLRPRSLPGLIGIVTAPLLHGGFAHLFSNTAPLLVALTAILYLYPRAALRAIPIIWMGSGLLAWLIGRPTLHFGASGFIYGLLGFVFVSGILRLELRSVAVSAVVWFLYGSMVWGVLPIRPGMSWELHLSGAILGVALAIVYRHWDITPVRRYEWEDDDTVPDWFPRDEPGEADDGSETHGRIN